MTYGFRTYGLWKTSWWRNDDDKAKLLHTSTDEYSEMNEDLFKQVLLDQLDIPEYELTPEKIKEEFFSFSADKQAVSDACVQRIIKYYSFRKELYEKIIKLFTGDGIAKKLLEDAKPETLSMHFDIPPEGNNFSCEDPEYTGGQINAWIEVAVSES